MTDPITEEQFKRISDGAYLLSGQKQDEIKDFMLHTVIDEVLAYCNRNDVPAHLERIISRIGASVLSAENINQRGNLTSYKEGDASWTWDYSPETNTFNEANLLENFRCIRSIGDDDTNILD